MYERHERKQYFFDQPTLDRLGAFLARWSSPACLCAPLLGKRRSETGVRVRILDVDRRFEPVRGFRFFDLYRPEWLGEAYDLVLCDPPFFNVSLSQLFEAIRLLSRNDVRQPLLISYLERRSGALLGTFAPFRLRPTGFRPTYQSVEPVERNRVELFGNLDEEELGWLRGGREGES